MGCVSLVSTKGFEVYNGLAAKVSLLAATLARPGTRNILHKLGGFSYSFSDYYFMTVSRNCNKSFPEPTILPAATPSSLTPPSSEHPWNNGERFVVPASDSSD